MRESLTDLVLDDEALNDELPDLALEIAAGKYWEVGNPFTIAFCSGLDTCPSHPQPPRVSHNALGHLCVTASGGRVTMAPGHRTSKL